MFNAKWSGSMKMRIVVLSAVVGLTFAVGASAAGNPAVRDMMGNSDCFACHAVDHAGVGPSFKDVAARYHGAAAPTATVAKLAEKVINGGNGSWNAQTGGMAMTPHPQLSKAQATQMVQWVLAQ
ncbi:MAG: c-type cytochrome [Betaproteobacteria bacterium]|nr:c-type cytochrome [Betaproteobacteria bacterium]